MVWLENCCVDILFLEGIGQFLYHVSQLPLALQFGALEIQETSVGGDAGGVETVVDESLHRTFDHLAQDLALARLSLSLGPYSIEELSLIHI